MTLPLVVRIDADDSRSADMLKQDGWREIEVLETWSGTLFKPQVTDLCDAVWMPLGRKAVPDDMSACIEIAKRAFVHDRLHRDMEVQKEEADQAKEDWVKRVFSDKTMAVWVAEWDGKIVAFAALREWRGDSRKHYGSYLDLIAVDPDYHGNAIGVRLLRTALDYPGGLTHLKTGTQEHNHQSRAMYRTLGLQPVYRQKTFHK